MDLVEQSDFFRLVPPFLEPAAVPVADDDEIGADAVRDRRYVHQRIAEHELTLRGYAVLYEPAHALVEQLVGRPFLAVDQLRRVALRHRDRDHVATDGE